MGREGRPRRGPGSTSLPGHGTRRDEWRGGPGTQGSCPAWVSKMPGTGVGSPKALWVPWVLTEQVGKALLWKELGGQWLEEGLTWEVGRERDAPLSLQPFRFCSLTFWSAWQGQGGLPQGTVHSPSMQSVPS